MGYFAVPAGQTPVERKLGAPPRMQGNNSAPVASGARVDYYRPGAPEPRIPRGPRPKTITAAKNFNKIKATGNGASAGQPLVMSLMESWKNRRNAGSSDDAPKQEDPLAPGYFADTPASQAQKAQADIDKGTDDFINTFSPKATTPSMPDSNQAGWDAQTKAWDASFDAKKGYGRTPSRSTNRPPSEM